MSVSRIVALSLMATVCFALSCTCSAQDLKFEVTLESSHVADLKRIGYLESVVKDETKRDQINIISLQFADTKNNAPVSLNPGVSFKDGTAIIVVDNALLEKIKGQPVQIRVSDEAKGFKNLSLIYDVPSPLSDVESINGPDGNPLDVVYLRLEDAQEMAGGIFGLETIDLNTKFGNVTIPLNEIAGVRLHIDKQDSAVVVLNNGDSVTGVPTLKNLTVITDWGQADVLTEFVESVTATSGARFREEASDFGPRWVLDTGNSIAPAAPPAR